MVGGTVDTLLTAPASRPGGDLWLWVRTFTSGTAWGLRRAGTQEAPPSCAPGFAQPGFLPTHSQWDLTGGGMGVGDRGLPGTQCSQDRGSSMLEFQASVNRAQRLAPEFQTPGPVPGEPTPPGVTCGPGGRGWAGPEGATFMGDGREV